LAISHDGRFVAVVDKNKSRTKESLLILDLLTGKSQLIRVRSGSEYFGNELAWSPDNRYIATAIGVGNPVGFAVIDRETGALRAIGACSYANVMGLFWFPDGKHWLAKADRGNSLSQLVLVDDPSGETRQIIKWHRKLSGARPVGVQRHAYGVLTPKIVSSLGCILGRKRDWSTGGNPDG
jgi:dipeptidyl aminopeptidase/acylaminoacyl peptidase